MKTVMQHWHIYQPRRYDKSHWNSKINKECYKPNAEKGNFNFVSFDLGPTLAQWLKKNDPSTFELIAKSDKGQAMAMPHSHRIMPLVRHDEDIKTQIIWGKKYFKSIFGRETEGMWLPETATSKRVLKAMAEEGIKYTTGAPWQKKGEQCTTKPFKIKLDDKEITYFFYHPFSGDVSFHAWTTQNADATAAYISQMMNNNEVMLLAWDGELIGHHRKDADLWAEYFPKAVEKIKGLRFITLNDYLKKNKVYDYAEISENSSWSCHCGLDRWKKGCYCTGNTPKSYQEAMLKAFEKLEDKVHEIFEEAKYFNDPWEARNDFIDIELGNISKEDFLKKHLKEKAEAENALELLKAEYHCQIMFTSCGWYFENMGLEAEYNIMDAAKAINHVKNAIGKDVKGCLKGLHHAYNWKTNVNAYSILEKSLSQMGM